MSKKNKNKKAATQGTYALCITAGVILGFGLGAITANVLASTVGGAVLGTAAAYYFSHMKKPGKH